MSEVAEIAPVVQGQDLTIAEILAQLPEQIVWDTAEMIQQFRTQSPRQVELWDHNALGELVNEVIEYLADYHNSLRGIEEVAAQMRMQFCRYVTGDSDEEATFISESVTALGLALRRSLLEFKAYQYRGALMYRFSHWVGDDIVLARMAYSELSFLDHPANRSP